MYTNSHAAWRQSGWAAWAHMACVAMANRPARRMERLTTMPALTMPALTMPALTMPALVVRAVYFTEPSSPQVETSVSNWNVVWMSSLRVDALWVVGLAGIVATLSHAGWQRGYARNRNGAYSLTL